MYTYMTSGVCSTEIKFDVVGDVISDVCFVGGCNGNLKGLSILLEGMKVEDAIAKLKGINCGGRGTSCPDQFVNALEKLVLKK